MLLVNVLAIGVFALIAACLVAWAAIIRRLRRGQPILESRPRRPVPWTLLDLAILLVVFVLLTRAAAEVIRAVNPTLAAAAAEADDAEQTLDSDRLRYVLLVDVSGKLLTCLFAVAWLAIVRRATLADFGLATGQVAADVRLGITAFAALAPPVYLIQWMITRLTPSQHPLTHALLDDPDTSLLLLAGAAAVLTAPVAEEFAFRLLLQGWLEKLTGRRPPRSDALDRRDFTQVPPIQESFDPSPDTAEAFGEVNPYAAPTLESAAAEPNELDDDGVTPPTDWMAIAISSLAFSLMHIFNGPDVIALFFLALGLGYLYQRTHRILPCIVVHFCLNAMSILLLWLSSHA